MSDSILKIANFDEIFIMIRAEYCGILDLGETLLVDMYRNGPLLYREKYAIIYL